jgi:uncharacterized membrane protein YphA (DoxX/SURF4 family)
MEPLDIVLLSGRVVLGGFFVLDRFRWFWDPEDTENQHYILNKARREHLRAKIESVTGLHSVWWSTIVACVEFLGGMGLILGIMTQLSALGILAILLIASHGTFQEKVIIKQHPQDRIDVVSCYFWTVEPLYMWFAAVILALGSGRFAVDQWLWAWLGVV